MPRRDDAGVTTVLNVDLKGDVAKLDVWWLGGPIGSFSCLRLGLLIWFSTVCISRTPVGCALF